VLQNEENTIPKMIHLTSLTDLSALKSIDFTGSGGTNTANPLLSSSKMWKHSPIKNESSDSVVNRSSGSLCSYESPVAMDMSVADESPGLMGVGESPEPRIQRVPQSKLNTRGGDRE